MLTSPDEAEPKAVSARDGGGSRVGVASHGLVVGSSLRRPLIPGFRDGV